MSEHTMRTLVIGGGGFIGKHLVAHLAAAGHEVYATHAPERGAPALPARWLPADVSQEQYTAALPEAMDAIIHLAQSRYWRDFPEQVNDVVNVNVRSVAIAADYARRVGARQMILASSGSVYTQTEHPARESDPIDIERLTNFYASSKLAGELAALPYQAYFAVTRLRIFMPYGSGQNPKMLLPNLVRRVQDGTPITLQSSDGMLISPTAVDDVCEAFSRCLRAKTNGVLNVAGGETLSLRQVGEQIGEVLGKPPIFESDMAQKPRVVVGETTALETALGWSPSTPFSEGLQQWLAQKPR
jgi:UDP-glucose 4-epimerase